ncbi:MAG TPA: hypothetical protein VFE57_09320 [Cyclobacteriaceae bacterium]|jgi:pantothenate kinase type III|nr:hypothetical protein [Cyclobacteriaceae bacterium]
MNNLILLQTANKLFQEQLAMQHENLKDQQAEKRNNLTFAIFRTTKNRKHLNLKNIFSKYCKFKIKLKQQIAICVARQIVNFIFGLIEVFKRSFIESFRTRFN